eukprot:1183734-Prorocentrum_minimum.AAC.4
MASIASFYGSSCANNSKGALNTPGGARHKRLRILTGATSLGEAPALVAVTLNDGALLRETLVVDNLREIDDLRDISRLCRGCPYRPHGPNRLTADRQTVVKAWSPKNSRHLGIVGRGGSSGMTPLVE